jgi:hypothetical protein
MKTWRCGGIAPSFLTSTLHGEYHVIVVPFLARAHRFVSKRPHWFWGGTYINHWNLKGSNRI